MLPSQGGQEWGLADQNGGGEPTEEGGEGQSWDLWVLFCAIVARRVKAYSSHWQRRTDGT